MMRARVAILSLVAGPIAMTTLVACGESAPTLDGSSDESVEAVQAAAVTIELQDAAGAKLGSCSGTLVSPSLVLTAGHCVTTAKKFKIEAPSVKKTSTAQVAVTHFRNYDGSSFSHPRRADVALLALEKQIRLDAYPKMSTKTSKSGAKAVRIGRSSENGGLTSTEVSLESGRTKGFPLMYAAGKLDGSEFLDTGGAVLDKDGKIVGVVSVRGKKSNTLFVSRTDLFGKWITSSIECSSTLTTKGWGGNPWGGGGGGHAQQTPGWWGGHSFPGYGGQGGEIEGGNVADIPLVPGEQGGVTGPSGSNTPGPGDNLGGDQNSCPTQFACEGDDCSVIEGGNTVGGPTSTPVGVDPNGDIDGDGIPNGVDDDMDGDGIPNAVDPLPTIKGTPGDADGDGVPDAQDPFPTIPGKPGDMDADGIPDAQDDSDGDGIPDAVDPAPGAKGTPGDADGDGIADGVDPLPKLPGKPGDRDGDGLADGVDPNPDVPNQPVSTTPGTEDKCPGEEVCPTSGDGNGCFGPNCGGCDPSLGSCVDNVVDYGASGAGGNNGPAGPLR